MYRCTGRGSGSPVHHGWSARVNRRRPPNRPGARLVSHAAGKEKWAAHKGPPTHVHPSRRVTSFWNTSLPRAGLEVEPAHVMQLQLLLAGGGLGGRVQGEDAEGSRPPPSSCAYWIGSRSSWTRLRAQISFTLEGIHDRDCRLGSRNQVWARRGWPLWESPVRSALG